MAPFLTHHGHTVSLLIEYYCRDRRNECGEFNPDHGWRIYVGWRLAYAFPHVSQIAQ